MSVAGDWRSNGGGITTFASSSTRGIGNGDGDDDGNGESFGVGVDCCCKRVGVQAGEGDENSKVFGRTIRLLLRLLLLRAWSLISSFSSLSLSIPSALTRFRRNLLSTSMALTVSSGKAPSVRRIRERAVMVYSNENNQQIIRQQWKQGFESY